MTQIGISFGGQVTSDRADVRPGVDGHVTMWSLTAQGFARHVYGPGGAEMLCDESDVPAAVLAELRGDGGQLLDALAWARTAVAGEYLARYTSEQGDDPGSRCGYGDDVLDEAGRILGARGLRLAANDLGLVAEVDYLAEQD